MQQEQPRFDDNNGLSSDQSSSSTSPPEPAAKSTRSPLRVGPSERTTDKESGKNPNNSEENPTEAGEKVAVLEQNSPETSYKVQISIKYEVTKGSNGIPKYSKALKQKMVDDFRMLTVVVPGMTPDEFCAMVPGTPAATTFVGWLDKFPSNHPICQEKDKEIFRLKTQLEAFMPQRGF